MAGLRYDALGHGTSHTFFDRIAGTEPLSANGLWVPMRKLGLGLARTGQLLHNAAAPVGLPRSLANDQLPSSS